jgi:hypothetical protein
VERELEEALMAMPENNDVTAVTGPVGRIAW